MNINDFLELAQMYSDLGWAVQEQLQSVARDSSEENLAEQNSNALDRCLPFLQRLEEYGVDIEGIDAEIQNWVAS